MDTTCKLALSALCLSVLGLEPAQAQPQSQTGVLGSAGVSLENSLVKFHFAQNSNGLFEFEVVDKTVNPEHAFKHRGDFPWLIEVLDLSSLLVEPITPANCTGLNVTWFRPSPTKLRLTWSDCGPADDLGFKVRLTVELDPGSDVGTWELQTPVNTMDLHSFWSGRFVFSLEEPNSPLGAHYLLDPLGGLTTDPAIRLPDWALGTPECPEPRLRKPVFNYLTQLAAYYDDDGMGFYLQGNDPTVTEPRSHFYKSVSATPPSSPRMEYAYGVWQDGVLQPGNQLDGVTAKVGRFQGDWVDAVERYRDWLAGTVVTSAGRLLDRQAEIPDEILRMQQMIPLGIGAAIGTGGSYTATGTNRNMWDAVSDYQSTTPPFPVGVAPLQHVVAWQFGPEWVEGEDCGVGGYQLKPTWAANFADMESNGIPLLSYILDHAFAYDADQNPNGACFDPTCRCVIQPNNDFWSIWAPVAMRAISSVSSNDFVPPDLTCAHSCTPPISPIPKAKIEPGSQLWLDRCSAVAINLKSYGVDGFFLDNLFPLFNEHCFSQNHSHEPGYGKYLQQGMADMVDSFMGDLGWTFTEAYMEFYIDKGATISGSTSKTDILTLGQDTDDDGEVANPYTVAVPIEAFLYHDYAVSRPINYSFPFMLNPADIPTNAKEYSVLSGDPINKAIAERGASRNIAYAVVNGSPLFCGDTNGLLSPMAADWSFDLPQSVQDSVPEAIRVLNMARRLSGYRGIGEFHRFLTFGQRKRDLPFQTSVPSRDVYLPWLTQGFPDVEREHVPDLVQGVWEDPLTGDIGVAIANHYATAAAAHVVRFDPADYAGVPNAYNVRTLAPNPLYTDSVRTQLGQFTGAADIPLPTIPAQGMVFLLFSQN